MNDPGPRGLSDGRQGFHGVCGRPFVDLEPYLDLSPLEALHEEICRGLCHVEPEYTGGGLKTMGVCAEPVMADPYIDYGDAIAALDEEGFRRFVSLARPPCAGGPGQQPPLRVR